MGTIIGILGAYLIISLPSLVLSRREVKRFKARLKSERNVRAQRMDAIMKTMGELQNTVRHDNVLRDDLVARNRAMAKKIDGLLDENGVMRVRLAVYENRFPQHFSLIVTELEKTYPVLTISKAGK